MRTLDVARELAEEFDELDETDKDQLKESLEDLVKTTPRTPSRPKALQENHGQGWTRVLRSDEGNLD